MQMQMLYQDWYRHLKKSKRRRKRCTLSVTWKNFQLQPGTLRLQLEKTLSLEHRLANFLILNRSKPHTVTGQSPAELFLGRQIRNCFTLLKPNLNRAVEEQQLKQKEHHDEGRVKPQEFKLSEVVLVLNWRRGAERWIPGRITQVKGPHTYLVRCEDQI